MCARAKARCVISTSSWLSSTKSRFGMWTLEPVVGCALLTSSPHEHTRPRPAASAAKGRIILPYIDAPSGSFERRRGSNGLFTAKDAKVAPRTQRESRGGRSHKEKDADMSKPQRGTAGPSTPAPLRPLRKLGVL